MRVLVCGGGVIGAATARFLARRGAEVVLVERTAIACAASGKSGGFLARDWCDGTPLQELARRSFDLHDELAATVAGDWGYRRLTTHAGADGRGGRRLDWLADGVALRQRLGGPDTTAQVHPRLFTEALVRDAEVHGARVEAGEVRGLLASADGSRVAGVEVDGRRLAGDAVVLALGPWSILAAAWLPLPPVFGLKGHSVVFETGDRIGADALFLELREASGGFDSPEVYPRPDGTTYVCGLSSESPLPVDPARVEPDAGAIERLRAMCARASPVLAGARVLAAQACYRPVTRDGLPLLGAAGPAGCFVATGHNVWGMLNAPASGEAMADLVLDGAARHVDLSAFDPGRMAPFDPAGLRRG